MTDTQAIGILASHAMEEVAERFGDDATLLTVALVIEVESADGSTDTLVTATDDRLWVQAAFLKEGVHALDREMDRLEESE